MKKKRNPLLIVVVVAMIMVLAGGIVISVIDNVGLGKDAKAEKEDLKENDDIEIKETGAWTDATCYVGDYVMYIETLQAGHPGQDNVIHGAGFDWVDEAGNTVWVNQDYVYEDKGLSDYFESTENLKSITVGNKEFLYEALSDRELWMYYSIDEETCVIIKLCILDAFDTEGNGVDIACFNLEDVLDEDIMEQAIRFEVSER